MSGKLLGEDYTQAELLEKYIEKEHDIDTGDVIVLFSDGLLERENMESNYSRRRFSKIIEENKGKTVQEIKDKIVSDTMDFYKGVPQNDDITLVVIKVVFE